MKLHPFLTGITILLCMSFTGIALADENTTTTITATATTSAGITPITTTATSSATTTPDQNGGSVYFETYPVGATIWLDNVNIGTSPFTYFSEKTGIREVRIWKKGYLNYTGTVTVTEGKMERFYARLTEAPRELFTEIPSTAPVTMATTIRKSTLSLPTPWPSTPESPVDLAVIISGAALGAGFFVIRRR